MNQVGNITVEMVDQFQILENYEQSFPKSHFCKIRLSDSRKFSKNLIGPDIYILIQAIADEKIVFKRSKDKMTLSWQPQTIGTFNCYKDFPYEAFKIGCKSPPTPEELLTSFKDNHDTSLILEY